MRDFSHTAVNGQKIVSFARSFILESMDLIFLWFPLCRGEAGLLVTPMYGYFCQCDAINRVVGPKFKRRIVGSRIYVHFPQFSPCDQMENDN